MATYQVETEDGTYEVEVDDGPSASDIPSWGTSDESGVSGGWGDSAPESRTPTIGEASKYVGKSFVRGLANTADLLDYVNPFSTTKFENAAREAQGLPKKPTFRDFADQYVGNPEESGPQGMVITGAVPRVAGAAMEGAAFPLGGPVGNAVASAGSEVAQQMFPDSVAAPIVGALAGAGLTGAARSASNMATSAGKAFERSSIGAGYGDYLKSLKAKGLIEDADTGELTSRLSQAIDEIGATEGWGVLRDPQRLAARNKAVMQETGAKIGAGLKAADAAGVTPTVDLMSPQSATQKLINSSHAEKADLQEAFDEFLNRFTDPKNGWDGSVQGLNSWKSSLGNMAFSGSAKGSLKPAVERKLQRAITADLMNGADDAVTKTGFIDKNAWQALKRTYANHAEVAPILNPELATQMASTPAKLMRGLLRTSGGTLTTPTIIGSVLGGAAGGPVGLAAGAALGALASPTGEGIASKVLQSAGATGRGIVGDSTAASAITAALANNPDAANAAITSLFSRAMADEPTGNAETFNSMAGNLGEYEKYLGGADKLAADVFSPGKSMPEKQDVKAVEQQIDADPFYSALYEAESGRNPNAKNPNTSASGGFQFVKATAKGLGLKDPFDLGESFEKVKEMTETHKRKFGDDPATLYAAHYLGETVLRKYLNGKPLSEKEQAQVDYLNSKALPDYMAIYNRLTKPLTA